MTDIRAALEALAYLTVCDVCMSVFLGTAWCHDQRTAEIGTPQFERVRAALAAASPPVAPPPNSPQTPAPTPPSVEALRDALLADLAALAFNMRHPSTQAGAKAMVLERLDAIIAAARADERTRLSGRTHHEGDGCEDHP